MKDSSKFLNITNYGIGWQLPPGFAAAAAVVVTQINRDRSFGWDATVSMEHNELFTRPLLLLKKKFFETFF